MENIYENKFFFLINPNAGNEKGEKEWPNIIEHITKNDIEFDFAFTESVGHAEEIVKNKIKQGYRKIIVIGGDGTLNETVNGILKQTVVPSDSIYLGLIQMGTGNDWSRYYGFGDDYDVAIRRFKRGNTEKQDVGKIVYCNGGEESNVSYFINIAGLCFDSVVVDATNKIKKRGRRTKFAYLFCLLKSLIHYKPWELKIYINNEILEDKFLSISIGNGRYSGGGMMQTPNAIINDGLLDVTIYQNMSKFKIIRSINKLYNGNILTISGIRSFRTKSFKIESKQKIFAEVDGEIIGSTPYFIGIVESAINVYV